MLLNKAAQLVSHFIKGMTWSIPNENGLVYLTFDDGPTPEVTEWTLELLNRKKIKSTFFCLGKNVKQNQSIYKEILSEGHSVGNHTMNHISGWKTDSGTYISEVMEASKYIDSDLFRPPYGEISPQQYYYLKDHFRIIMWDHLSEDYNNKHEKEVIIKKATNNLKSGSIIVMHDSIKAKQNLKTALEKIIDTLLDNGYQPAPIPYNKKSDIVV
jgi:peptidoglycan/xylan/chitin deacetylase (PgdA/CDA1 family)